MDGLQRLRALLPDTTQRRALVVKLCSVDLDGNVKLDRAKILGAALPNLLASDGELILAWIDSL